jgi:hypothetical protein
VYPLMYPAFMEASEAVRLRSMGPFQRPIIGPSHVP